VIGREFSYELLHTVSTQTEDDLQSALAKLTEAELIYTRGIPPEASYQFKHALLQDAAYEALLKSRRRVLHRRVAETLVEKFPAVADTQPELLARHWTEAGVAEPAVAAWREAGRQAAERFANAEAVANLSRALEVLNNLPESNERDTPQVIKKGAESADRDRQEFEIYLEYLAVLSLTHGFTRAEVAVAHSRAQELCERLGETSRMYAVLQGSAGFHLRRGEYKKLHDCATRILELSANAANPTWAVSAHYLIGHSLCCLGDLATAHEHLDLASRLVGASPSPDIATNTAKVCALAVDALTLWTWGYPDRARAKLDELLIFADATKNPYDLAIAIIYAHIVTLFRREFAQALTYAEQGLKVASEKQFEWLETSLIWSRDACRILAGTSCDITKPQAAFKVYFGSEAKLYKPDNCTVLAECCGVLGQAEVGLPMIEEAFSAMNENDERRCEPETWRVKGLLLHQLALSRGESRGESEPLAKEAESCFIRAIELANRRQSRSWELRAALTFGKILVQSGRRREAREILVPIHKAFTEGFDTPDFVEATTLLDEVRSA
jgi:tetratricopeptide (TPR) repeat protein